MSALKYFFGVVARPQTWLDYVYLWLAFPLGLFYFIFLVVGLSVGLSLVIVWVGIPLLMLVAGAWYLFAAFERVLARELLRVPVAPAPRAWEAVDGVWNKIKAHFSTGSTWKDLVFLLLRLPLGIASFTIVVTQAALAAAFIGAPLFERYGAPWIGGQRIESAAVAFVLVPVGVLIVFATFHVVHGWAWVCGKLATALFGDGTAVPSPVRGTPGAWPGSPQYPQAPPWPQAPQGPQYPQAPPSPQAPQAPQYPQGPQQTQPPQGAQRPQGAPPAQTAPAPQVASYAQTQLAPGLKYARGPRPQPQLQYAQPWPPQVPQPPQATLEQSPGLPQGTGEQTIPQPTGASPVLQETPPSPAPPRPATTAPPVSPGSSGEPAAPTPDPATPGASVPERPTEGAAAPAADAPTADVPAADVPAPDEPQSDAATPDAPTRPQ
ncbi:MAG: sensor domain-containing protein [Thermoleophilia bacterium]|nr:sensor domain-containing protein [Thermoleophilia bacterium]